jgi:hypothetical protein
MYDTKGVRGLYTGYLATISTTMPYSATFFYTYEFSKKMLVNMFHLQHTEKVLDHPPFYIGLGSGAIAGMVAATVTNPMDVVKTRLQVQEVNHHDPVLHYRGIVDAFMSIYKQEGIATFFKGIGPRVVSVIPSTAISMGTCK